MPIRRNLSVIFLLVSIFPGNAKAQDQSPCDLRFLKYLIVREQYREALFLIDSSDCIFSSSYDTLNYYKGWSLYSLKQLEKSGSYFLKVSKSSVYYPESRLFAAYNYAHSGNYNLAMNILNEFDSHDEKLAALKNFVTSGIYLLENDTSGYVKSSILVDKRYYEFTESYENIRNVYYDMKMHRMKSPLLAGSLSAIIPGAGKFYSGRKAEAVSAFLASAGLGFVTWESARKTGYDSFRTILSGSVFAIFYVSNIYGAVVSARVVETEYQNNVKNTVLFNLHIPLRNSFER